mmetsp:Transcript_36490/g.109649  ORF Transcript_36490/g.109649 Transcript_36490/m.109649 type:complete len:201 (-) Transcript_36490:1637-2239(-)
MGARSIHCRLEDVHSVASIDRRSPLKEVLARAFEVSKCGNIDAHSEIRVSSNVELPGSSSHIGVLRVRSICIYDAEKFFVVRVFHDAILVEEAAARPIFAAVQVDAGHVWVVAIVLKIGRDEPTITPLILLETVPATAEGVREIVRVGNQTMTCAIHHIVSNETWYHRSVCRSRCHWRVRWSQCHWSICGSRRHRRVGRS